MSPTRKKKLGAVALVGAGPGDIGLLTVRGADLLAEADVVVLDRPEHDPLLAHCRDDVEIVDAADGEPVKAITAAARAGRRVVRLLTGDVFWHGTGSEEAASLAKAHLEFEVVPGLSAAAAVPTYAGIPLTARKAPGEVRVVDASLPVDWAEVAAGTDTLVVLHAGDQVAKVAAALVDAGRAPTTPVAVTSNGTLVTQRTSVGTLEEPALEGPLGDDAVLVVGDVVKHREKLSWWETKPLFGWRVLVPRTKDQAGALSEQLRSYGAVPVEVPTIAVEPPRTPAPMDRAIKGLVAGRYQWVAFTSTNAVKAVREKFEEVGLDARAMGGVKVAAVGEATAEALQAWGIRPELVPTGQQSSEGLLAEFPEYDDVFDLLDRVFLPRADIATETLVAGLKDRGWAVDDITAYRTVRAAPPPAPIREAIKTGGFDAVLFTSSSTVRNLVGIAGKPHASSVIAVIGPQTAETAEELGLRVDVHSPAPSVSALAEALADYGRERRAGDETEPPGKANRSKPAKPAAKARKR